MEFAKELANRAIHKIQDLQRDIAAVQGTPLADRDPNSSSSARAPSLLFQIPFKEDTKSLTTKRPTSPTDTALTPTATPYEARLAQFQQLLCQNTVDLKALRLLTYHGVPDSNGLRGTVWKLILGYLPICREEWPAELAKRRQHYRQLCEELIVDPRKQQGNSGPSSVRVVEDPLHVEEVGSSDHPLSLDACSTWNTYFEVERDVLRTHPDMAFFSGDSSDAHTHREELKRALFMYAKLNPGLRYIQGMNELLAPLYYLFKTGPSVAERDHAECDAFWGFMDLISEFRDHFCQSLDSAEGGIKCSLRKLMALLKQCDVDLWRHIEVENKVDPQFYAFRWLTLLLSQEFAMPDTMVVWDAILGDPRGRLDCLMRVCVAMLLYEKDRLMEGDFAVIVKTLQRYPPVDVRQILNLASTLPSHA